MSWTPSWTSPSSIILGLRRSAIYVSESQAITPPSDILLCKETSRRARILRERREKQKS